MKKTIFFTLLFFSIFSYSQMGIGTTSPNASAQLDITSTTKGFLPPRMTYAQKKAIVSPATGLLIWCSDCGSKGEMQVFNSEKWVNLIGDSASLPIVTGGNAYCDGTYQTEVVEITSSTGAVWMDRNLGASQAAISIDDDYTAYGCLYQWGRGNDGHASMNWTSSSVGTAVNGSISTPSLVDVPVHASFIYGFGDWRSTPNNSLWTTSDTTNNNPCPTNFRVPTRAQFDAEISAYDITSSQKAFSNGPSGGFKFVKPGVRWPLGLDGSEASSVFLGGYWTSTAIEGTYSSLFTVSTTVNITLSERSYGYSVRCIKNPN